MTEELRHELERMRRELDSIWGEFEGLEYSGPAHATLAGKALERLERVDQDIKNLLFAEDCAKARQATKTVHPHASIAHA